VSVVWVKSLLFPLQDINDWNIATRTGQSGFSTQSVTS